MLSLDNQQRKTFLPGPEETSNGFLVLFEARELFASKELETRLEAFSLLLGFYSTLRSRCSRAVMRYIMDGNLDHVRPYNIQSKDLSDKVFRLCVKFSVYYLKFLKKQCFSKENTALCIAGALLGEDSCFFKQFSLKIDNDEIGFVQYLADVTGFFDIYMSQAPYLNIEDTDLCNYFKESK